MSIRSLSAIIYIGAILAIVFSIGELQRTASHTQALYELEQERQRCDMAIQQLMDGSDYLTTQMQQLVVKGDRAYMDNYWQEIHVTKSRETALEVIYATHITPEESAVAQAGKDASDELIQTEVWAMRMMAECVGLAQADMPDEVAAFQLTAEEAALTAQQKQNAAIACIFGPEYSMAKDTIRSHVNAFRNHIANRYADEALRALASSKETSFYIIITLIVFFLLFIASVVCFARQVVSPLIGFASTLTNHADAQTVRLEARGAKEIRQFANAFNILAARLDQDAKRLERMSYTDYLTDVPNRASITEYVSRMIASGQCPLGLMIVDIDNFKHFNDRYGHALGDKVLKRVAQAVCTVRDPEQGISGRLCGEEFIVVMRNADEVMLRDMADTILKSVRDITSDDVVLPGVSDFQITVSIGGMIWHGDMPSDFIILLSRADKGLYISKETGKDKYTFHKDECAPDGSVK